MSAKVDGGAFVLMFSTHAEFKPYLKRRFLRSGGLAVEEYWAVDRGSSNCYEKEMVVLCRGICCHDIMAIGLNLHSEVSDLTCMAHGIIDLIMIAPWHFHSPTAGH